MSSDVPDIQATTNPPVQPVAETIDFDMTDISAGKPASAATPIAKNSSSNKSDAKSNLIDFDIFAEPPPTTDKS
jgi:hypothetical protein